MTELHPDEIRKELESLRADVTRAAGTVERLAKDHSDWSAHGDWSSGSRRILGGFRLTSRLSTVAETEHLSKIVSDSSSENFVAVARSLKELLRED